MQRRDFVHLSLTAIAASILPTPLRASEISKLRDLAAHRKLLFGSAVSDPQFHRPDITALIINQCSILVRRKPNEVARHPSRTRPLRLHPSRFLHGLSPNPIIIPARGHNLCWHEHNPPWLDARHSAKCRLPPPQRTSKPSPAATKAASIPGMWSTKPSAPNTTIPTA